MWTSPSSSLHVDRSYRDGMRALGVNHRRAGFFVFFSSWHEACVSLRARYRGASNGFAGNKRAMKKLIERIGLRRAIGLGAAAATMLAILIVSASPAHDSPHMPDAIRPVAQAAPAKAAPM